MGWGGVVWCFPGIGSAEPPVPAVRCEIGTHVPGQCLTRTTPLGRPEFGTRHGTLGSVQQLWGKGKGRGDGAEGQLPPKGCSGHWEQREDQDKGVSEGLGADGGD